MDYSAQRYIPKGYSKVANKSGSAVAYISVIAGKFYALGFNGKARNTAFNYSFKTQERRDQYVTEFLKNADEVANYRKAQKSASQEKLAKPTTLKVGDVLRCSWGYDQTNIEYFEITKQIGPRMIEIREIAQMREETGFMQGQCVPCKGEYIGDAMRKKVSESERVRIYSFATAGKVEPKNIAGMDIFPAANWTAYA